MTFWHFMQFRLIEAGVGIAFALILGVWLYWRNVPAEARAIVDVNARCPACGHRNGKLRCVITAEGTTIQHQCQVCGAEFYEPTIVKGEKWRAQEPIGVRR